MYSLNDSINQTSRSNLLEVHELRSLANRTPVRCQVPRMDEESAFSSLIGSLMILAVTLILIITFPVSLFFCYAIIHDHEKAVLFRNGRLRSVDDMDTGLVFIMPFIDKYFIIDCRIVCYDIPPQKVLTKDSITVTVDAVVLYKVHNPIVAVTNIEDYSKATELLAATSMRNILGTKTLTEILMDSEAINNTLKTTLDLATDFWGVTIERIDIKNVQLPQSLIYALSAEAQATREAKAKYIHANGEKIASKLLAEAANVLDINPVAIHLRYLQTLGNISDNKQVQTIVVPFPLELFQISVQ